MLESKSELREQLNKALRELEACEARWRSIISRSPHGVLIVDSGGTIRFANPAATAIFGCRTEELLGEHFEMPDVSDKPVELSLKSRDNRMVAVEIWRIETEFKGEPAWFIALHDITERKRGEQELRKLFRAISESPSIVMITDARGTIEYVNPKFTEVTGYSSAEAIGRNPRFLKSDKVPPETYQELWETIISGKEWRGEMVNTKKNGELYCEFAAISPIKDIEGAITHFVAVTEDITERKQTEEALRESRNRAQAIITSALDAVVEIDENGTIMAWNPKAEEIFGWSAAEAIGRRPSETVIPEQYREAHEAGLKKFLATGEGPILNQRVELSALHRDGHEFPVELTITPIRAGSGYTFTAFLRDISERKRAEEKFRGLLESAPDAMVIVDGKGEICIVNSQTEELFGFERGELYGQQVEMLMPERFRNAHIRHRADYSLNPHLRRLGTVTDLYGLHKDGHEFPVDISLSPLSTEEGILVIAAVRDVTERKRAEDALRFSEARYRALYRDNPIMIATLDADLTMLSVNPTCVSQLGYSKDELEGQPVLKLFHEDDRPAVTEQLRMCLQNPNQEYRWQFRKIRKDGGLLWVEELARAVYDLNGALNILVVCQDITARKHTAEEIERLNTDLAARAAELESANRELEAFNYSVAHDLRKPLTVINGYCQAIMEMCGNKLDQQCRGYLKETYDGTLRMNRLIDALLDFSQLARCEFKPETANLSAMARDIAAELSAEEPERRVTFAIADGVTADGDPALLRVVLENLLGNAWKYTGKREEAVIEFGMAEIEGKPACYVRDNGAGFDMAYADKLFVPFQRLPGTNEFRGHGIGLATVERVIRRHGGRVWAEGEPGKGATFWFTLPAEKVAPST